MPHTPGPLVVKNGVNVFTDRDYESGTHEHDLMTADCGIEWENMSLDEMKANARLYAAAPAMLDALKDAEAIASASIEKALVDAGFPAHSAAKSVREHKTLQKIRAAIALAEGRV